MTRAGCLPKGKRRNIEEQKSLCLFRSVTRKDSSLHCHTVSDGLVRVDALVRLLSVKEVGNQLNDSRDMSGTTDQHNFVNIRFVDL
jgi:hypothetical protein